MLISKLLDMSGIDERRERKHCRSGDNPEIIIAGGTVKNRTTVIIIDGALPKEYFVLW